MKMLFSVLVLCFFSTIDSTAEFCITMGTSAYVLITITSSLDYADFLELLISYSKLMPVNETITYQFNFGDNEPNVITSDNLEKDLEEWISDSAFMKKMWNLSKVSNTPEESPITAIHSIFHRIGTENQQLDKVIMKKQVVLLTDYTPLSIILIMNNDTHVNQQKLGLFHQMNTSNIEDIANFPVYSVAEVMENSLLSKEFQKNLNFKFPTIVHERKPPVTNSIFLTTFDSSALTQVVDTTTAGEMCVTSQDKNKMFNDFILVHYLHNYSIHDLTIPFIGSKTLLFAHNCINHISQKADSKSKNCESVTSLVIDFFNHTRFLMESQYSNISFTTLIVDDIICAAPLLTKVNRSINKSIYIRIVTTDSLNDVYEKLTLPLINKHYVQHDLDEQVIYNSEFYLSNYSTTCRKFVPQVPLFPARPYHKPKHFYIALDDMIWISLCATISVTTFGILIYQYVKKQQKKQMELLSEMILQPRVYKTAKECPKVARLPWEIKSDRVHIDREFLLGEGTISNVYLGKLKGKAPILQWINRVEMKQYQDCAVAVRVPRHFDEPEEDQLFREISSMRRLRHHDHIALFLGWTNKNDLVCSLLELTHMNLLKYLGQISETVTASGGGMTSCIIPYQTLFKIIWEICDGIAYIHSRNLIHRDLTARNILLTTGLRAKISGFGFCSDPDDPKFAGNSLALRYLPVRWLAPESFQGRFTQKSDTWSFGVLLYEVFTLGEVPYEDLQKPEEIIESVRKSRIPAHPKFASKQTYMIMQRCFHSFADRRPNFNHLKEIFQSEMENYYQNQAFEEEEDML